MKTILIVDDEEDIRTVISMRLQQLGHRIVHATIGSAALDFVMRDHPDLVLLDWTLPDMNGKDVLIALKRNPVTAHIPVIVLTGTDNPPDKTRALAIGACAYLIKPVSMRDLEVAVLEALQQKN